MTPLPDQFRSDGFDFRMLKRAGDVALLVKSKPDGTPSYEVVVIQHRPAEVICGREYPAREAMPRSEGWGASGWTYIDRDAAEVRFDKLANRRKDAISDSKGLKMRHDYVPQAVLPLASEVLT